MYTLHLKNQPIDFLKKADRQVKKRIIKKLKQLEENPELGKPMTAQLAGFRSLRIGDYRAIYAIIQDKLIISVIKIDHRKKVY
jgi:mRNA interferase RelE/StbE